MGGKLTRRDGIGSASAAGECSMKNLNVAALSLDQLWELVLMGQMEEARYWEIARSRAAKPKLKLVVNNT